MAMQASDAAEELVTCTICFEHFNSPKTLPCLHTFCESCLERHLQATRSKIQYVAGELPCPTCREPTVLPPGNVKGLRTDFKICTIVEMLNGLNKMSVMCGICKTIRQETTATHFCRDCGLHFCNECIFRHSNTTVFDGHTVRPLAAEEKATRMCREHEMELLRYFCSSCETSICTLCAMTEHMMHTISDLDVGKAKHEHMKRLSNLSSKVSEKLSQMESILNKLDTFEAKLRSSHSETKDSIEKRADDIVRHVRKQESDLLEKLDYQLDGKLDIITVEREALHQVKERLEQLKENADAAMEQEDIQPPFFADYTDLVKELKSVSAIHLLNPDDFNEVDASFALELPKGTPSLGNLGDANISSNMQFMSYVPISLKARITDADFDWPSDVSLMQGGEIIVADTENYQLQVFDHKGRFQRALAVGEVKPAGVAATKVGTIMVTDILERCVKIFNEMGTLLFDFGHDLFDSPAGIAINNYGEVIVSDIGHHCVTRHNSQGDLIGRLGGPGKQDNKFDNPWHVACNENSEIIVSDMGNHAVKIFSRSLKLLVSIKAPSDDFPLCPAGITCDLQGNLLIADSANNTISVYSTEGHLIDNILTDEDGVMAPRGLTMGSTGQLIVTLCGDQQAQHEVRLYQLYE